MKTKKPHTQYSFKPRNKSLNTLYSSTHQIQYDSKILSKRHLTNEISSQVKNCYIDTSEQCLRPLLIETKESQANQINNMLGVLQQLMTTQKRVSELFKFSSQYNNIKILSYVKQKNNPKIIEKNFLSPRFYFGNNKRLKLKIPHPVLNNFKNKELKQLININVNLVIQEQKHCLTQEAQGKSTIAILSKSANSKSVGKMKTHNSLSKERDKRRLNKSKIIAERQNSLKEINQKIDLLEGTFSEIKLKKRNCIFREKKQKDDNILNEKNSQLNYLSQNSIHSLESYDKEQFY